MEISVGIPEGGVYTRVMCALLMMMMMMHVCIQEFMMILRHVHEHSIHVNRAITSTCDEMLPVVCNVDIHNGGMMVFMVSENII